MANPQKENGYTAIANEIMEALGRIRIAGEARQVLDVILRKTYGWNKKEDFISLSQFCLATGLSKWRVCHSIKKLEKMNLIIANKGNDKGNKYRFNKDFDTWKPLPKRATLPIKATTIANKGNKPLPIIGHTKDTITKDILHSKSNDLRPDIRIIEMFAFKKEMALTQEQKQSFIKRNLRTAQLLKSYPAEKIEQVMDWLKENADFKWTLESVGKFIDEDLTKISFKKKTLKL